MPYLSTSQEFLEKSAQLLEAYPKTTLITTKYHFPTTRRAEQHKRQKSAAKLAQKAPSSEPESAAAAPVAALVLKTYNPSTGIVLQYRTNKQQEVGRIITTLGKLAGGADVAGLGLSAPGVPAADVEMVDAGAEESAAAAAPAAAPAATPGKQQAGKGKKKGGKAKR